MATRAATRAATTWACAAALTVATAAVAAGGCGNRSLGRGGNMPVESKPPPGFPAQKAVPVDPALVAAARAELAALAKNGLPFEQAHVIEGLRFLSAREASAIVLSGLGSPSPAVRFAAAMSAGDLRLAAQEALLARADDPDARVRVAVRFALHRLGDFRLSRDLEQAAIDGNPKVRGVTAMALGRLGEPSAANVLRVLRADADATVRQQAEEALYLLGDDHGREAVVGLTISGHPDDAMIGLMALAEGKDARMRDHARGQLTNDYAEVALVAARAVGAMGGDDGYGVAMNGIKSPDVRQRQLAALAFGAIARTDAQPLLAPLLKDANAEVRAAAAIAVLQIAREPKKYSREGDLVQ